MKLSVKEIINLIESGELHYNQSTQRNFVYNNIEVTLDNGRGTMTKSGALINAILEDNVQLPAVFFWRNTDTGDLNVHDGKQRILSLYYFVKPTTEQNVSTKLNGKETIYATLSDDFKNKILNYQFDVVERTGSSEEEEKSFFLINTNALPLTTYECLSGMFYGKFLNQFENYIVSKKLDSIKPIGRGEQAYTLLRLMLGIESSKNEVLLIKDSLRINRNREFSVETFKADEKIYLFNKFIKQYKGGIKEKLIVDLILFILSNFEERYNDIINLYNNASLSINDIKTWNLDLHKTFIKKYVNDNIELSYQRFFSKNVKDRLYTMYGKCNNCGETSYGELEVDHIIPWKEGGKTILDNAQLLCKHCNRSKSDKLN